MDAVTFFKALADPTRLNLLSLIKAQEPSCVYDLTQQLSQPQSTVSRHLSLLKIAGLVTCERRGTWMWYSLNQDMPSWCHQVISLIEFK